jgi:hypothetical protein
LIGHERKQRGTTKLTPASVDSDKRTDPPVPEGMPSGVH